MRVVNRIGYDINLDTPETLEYLHREVGYQRAWPTSPSAERHGLETESASPEVQSGAESGGMLNACRSPASNFMSR